MSVRSNNRYIWNRRFRIRIAAAVLTLVLALSLGAAVAVARSMADAERATSMKTDSPMDKAPEEISLRAGKGTDPDQNYRMVLDGGDWLLSDQGRNDWSKAYTVAVPASIATALYKAGAIGDPTVGLNDAAAKELLKRDWYYKKSFNYSGAGHNVYLNFEGVADRMEVFLNGVKVGEHQGMFGGPYIDVSGNIKQGANELVVHLKPYVDYTRTVVFNCSYAWHYADLPPLGIWNSVTVTDKTDVALDHPFITTVSHETGTLDLSVDLVDLAGGQTFVNGTLYGTIKPKNFEGGAYSFEYKLPAAAEKGDRNVRLRFDLPEFRLWWPNGFGEQNLYTLETTFVSDSGSRTSDVTSFGVRTLKMVATGRKEQTAMYNRTAMINGKTLFLRGANWCTIDAAMNFTREDYDRILCRAKDQGLNAFRSWGGGMCETDDYYDLCDEYGICVYQEWPCCWDSQKIQPADVLYETVILNTKRIRNHPSLMVYGGGNEGEAPANDKVMNNIGKLTYQYDGTRDFWRQDGGYAAAGIRHDHIHWGGETPEHYATAYYDFAGNLHEYGLDAMMNLDSIARFATEKEMAQWPIDPKSTVAYHTATFNGAKGWTQTPYGYDIDTFIHYASQFVEVDSLASLVQGSQIAQTMADYLAAINSRANFPTQSMVFVYKFNDVYPGASWSVVDYYGAPKMAYWFLQDAFEPLTAALKLDRYDTYDKLDRSLTAPVYVLDDNDALAGSSWEVAVKAYDSRFRVVKEEHYTGSGSVDVNKQCGEFTLTAAQTASAPLFIVTTLYRDGGQTSRTFVFMNAGKDPGSLFATPSAEVEYRVSGSDIILTNKSDVPAVAVNFECAGVTDKFRPDDNYFWLEPGETKTVHCNFTDGVTGIAGFNVRDTGDRSAPKAPEKLTAVSERFDSVKLSWKKAGDVRYYELYVNGGLLAMIKGTADTYTAEGLQELSEYDFKLVAVDGGGNRSGESKTVTCRTIADNIAPRAFRFAFTGADTASVTFSREVDPDSAANTDYYIVNRGAKVTEAALQADGRTVLLKFEGLPEDRAGYTLTVMGVRDTSAGANPAERSRFMLDAAILGQWSFDDRSDVLTDESGYNMFAGNAGGAEYTEGHGGSAIRPNRGEIMLTTSDLQLKGTVISFWVKAESFKGFNVLLAKGEKISGHFEIYANEGELKLYAVDICDSSFGVNMKEFLHKWTHLCFVTDKHRMTVYVNGEKRGSVALSSDIRKVELPLYLGSLAGGQFMTDAALDDLLILSCEANSDLVETLYAGTYLKDLRFEKASYRLRPGTDHLIGVVGTNVDAASAGLTWSSSDETVATVDSEGRITAVADGTALITAASADGQFIERCLVEVGDFPDPADDNNVRRGLPTLAVIAIILVAAAVIALAVLAVFIVRSRRNSAK
ncbi:MAG: Ig-like domain-containing protein [Clostridia bacterium]|nr:Ig-like domain-containing protein [Clostridia bacterium]